MNLRPAAEIRESGGGVSGPHPPSHVANLQHHIFNAHFVPNCFASLCFVWVSVPCGEIKNARLSQQKGVGNYNSSSLPLPPEMCLLRFGSFRPGPLFHFCRPSSYFCFLINCFRNICAAGSESTVNVDRHAGQKKNKGERGRGRALGQRPNSY